MCPINLEGIIWLFLLSVFILCPSFLYLNNLIYYNFCNCTFYINSSCHHLIANISCRYNYCFINNQFCETSHMNSSIGFIPGYPSSLLFSFIFISIGISLFILFIIYIFIYIKKQ